MLVAVLEKTKHKKWPEGHFFLYWSFYMLLCCACGFGW